MKGLKEIYGILEDASAAIAIFNEEIATIEEEPFFKLQTEGNLFFIDDAYDLVKKYNIRGSVAPEEIEEAEKTPLIALGMLKYTGEDIAMMLEDILFQLDKEGRLAVIRKIIRRSEAILCLTGTEISFISGMFGFVSYGSKERFVQVEGKGQMSFDELSNLIALLVITSAKFLFHLGVNCVDFGIESAEQLVKDIYPDKFGNMNMNFFDKKDGILVSLPIFSCDTISKIYNKCDGNQWEHITENNFRILVNSDGKDQSLIIRKSEVNRTKYIFKKMANYIKDENRRKTWIKNIKKNIFNDVDFMKATLRTDKLSSGYSSVDTKFQESIDNL